MPPLPWLSPPAQRDLTAVTFTFKVTVAQSRPILNPTRVLEQVTYHTPPGLENEGDDDGALPPAQRLMRIKGQKAEQFAVMKPDRSSGIMSAWLGTAQSSEHKGHIQTFSGARDPQRAG